jgi:hypothetical protein
MVVWLEDYPFNERDIVVVVVPAPSLSQTAIAVYGGRKIAGLWPNQPPFFSFPGTILKIFSTRNGAILWESSCKLMKYTYGWNRTLSRHQTVN